MANNFDKVKGWISPMIISAFGMVLWSLMSEIRSDVKVLLKAQAQNDIKIENLDRRVTLMEAFISPNQLFAIKPKEIEVPKNNSSQRN